MSRRRRWKCRLLALIVAFTTAGSTAQAQVEDTALWERILLQSDAPRSEQNTHETTLLLLELGGDYQQALDLLRANADTPAAHGPAQWEVYLRLLIRTAAYDELEEALSRCEEELRASDRAICAFFSGFHAAHEHRSESAAAAFERAAELASDDSLRALALTNLAESYLALGDLDRAERHYRLASRAGGWNASALGGLSVIAALRGDFEAARLHMQNALHRETARGFIESDAVTEHIEGYREALRLLADMTSGDSDTFIRGLSTWRSPGSGPLDALPVNELRSWYSRCVPEIRTITFSQERCHIDGLSVDGDRALVACTTPDGRALLHLVEDLRTGSPRARVLIGGTNEGVRALTWTGSTTARLLTDTQTINETHFASNDEHASSRSEPISGLSGQIVGHDDEIEHLLVWNWQSYGLELVRLEGSTISTELQWSTRLTRSPEAAHFVADAGLIIYTEEGVLIAHSVDDESGPIWRHTFSESLGSGLQFSFDSRAGELMVFHNGDLIRLDAASGALREVTPLDIHLRARRSPASGSAFIAPLRGGELLVGSGGALILVDERSDASCSRSAGTRER